MDCVNDLLNCFNNYSYYTFIFIKPNENFSYNDTLINAEYSPLNEFLDSMKYTDFILYEHQTIKKYDRNIREYEEYKNNDMMITTFNDMTQYIENNDPNVYRYTFKGCFYKYMDRLIQSMQEFNQYTVMIAVKVYDYGSNKCFIKFLADYRTIYNELIQEYNLYHNNEMLPNDLSIINFIKLSHSFII